MSVIHGLGNPRNELKPYDILVIQLIGPDKKTDVFDIKRSLGCKETQTLSVEYISRDRTYQMIKIQRLLHT